MSRVGAILCTTVVLNILCCQALAQVSQPDVSQLVRSEPQVLFTKSLAPRSFSANPSRQELARFPVDLRKPETGVRVIGEPFFIAPDRTFYRWYGTRLICQFNRPGELLRAIRTWTQGSNAEYDPRNFTVDRLGRIFLLNEATVPVLVFDYEGRRLTELEQRIKHGVDQVSAQHQKRLGSGWWARCIILVDRGGVLHLCHWRMHVRINLSTGQVQTFEDHAGCRPRSDGTCWTVFDAGTPKQTTRLHYDVHGTLIGESSGWDETQYKVVVYNRDGQLSKQYTIPREVTQVEKLLPEMSPPLGMDRRLHTYVLRTPHIMIHAPLGGRPQLVDAVSYWAVCEYDAEGSFVGIRAIYNDVGEKPMIDEDGNVYWIEYDVYGDEPEEQVLRLMIAPVPQSAR